jgi:hypothetical protein
MPTAAVSISPIPVEPDEFIVDDSTVSVYLAIVVHAFRFVVGHNLLTADLVPVGTVAAVGG